jgi:hypothetical protein
MLEYNTKRNRLIIKEYGRNVQKMIEYALTVKDDEKRNETARAIVRVMSQINPENKDNPNPKKRSENVDYWHKLWDHLFIISDYKLDIECPFPKPIPENNELKSIRHNYRKDKIIYRTYGRNMQNVIKKISECPDEIKDEMSKLLANYLKKLYLLYNRDSVDNDLISAQLEELSEGKLRLPENFVLDATRDILRQNQSLIQQQNSKNSKSGGFNSSKNNNMKKSKRKKKKTPQA